jgi:hypothetical protein
VSGKRRVPLASTLSCGFHEYVNVADTPHGTVGPLHHRATRRVTSGCNAKRVRKINTHKMIASLIGGAATLAAVVGMTAGLAPASAAPSQSPGATLTVVDQNTTGPGTTE